MNQNHTGFTDFRVLHNNEMPRWQKFIEIIINYCSFIHRPLYSFRFLLVINCLLLLPAVVVALLVSLLSRG